MSFRQKLSIAGLALTVALGGSQALADQELFAELEQQAQSVRELDLLTPLNVTVISRDEMRQQQLESMEEEMPVDEVADWNAVLTFLGYIEPGVDMMEIYNAFTSEQVLGYYDPETQDLVVISTNDEGWNVTDKTTFVHETVHALQDQHFDLDAVYFGDDIDTDDRYFARLSLIEGDATVAEMIYLVDNDLIEQAIKELESVEMPSTDGVPFFFLETMYFPYTSGADFVTTLWREGGWDMVNEAWASPPNTSEQILHPEKYLAGEDALPVAIADPLLTFGDDWRELEYNENGEFGTRIFLESNGADTDDATAAAEGWGGDATYIVTNDDEIAMVWTLAWDSEEDAIEFYDTLIATETERLNATTGEQTDSMTRFSAEGRVGEVHRDGDVVTYYLAETDASLAMMVESQVGAEVQPQATPEPAATPSTPAAKVVFWTRES